MNFSDAEIGLYIRLLCVQWSAGKLPDDDSELINYGKNLTPVEKVKQKFKKCSDGFLRNTRMEIERKKQKAFRLSRSHNGKLGGRPRKASNNLVVLKTEAKKSSPSPSPSPIHKDHKASAKHFSSLQTELTARFHTALNTQWENDRQKWMGRIKRETSKCERVIAEVENAYKENRIKKGCAEYAEQTWKEFK